MKNDWIKIKNYYIFHSISLKELAKKFKVSVSAVERHSRKENWQDLKNKKECEVNEKVMQQTQQQAVDKKVAANKLHTQLYDKGLEVTNMLLDMYLEELKSGRKIKKATAYNIDFIMKAIAAAQKGQRLSLNIDNENIAAPQEPEVRIIEGINLDEI